MYRASFIILYYDQQMHNYFTNYPIVIICEIIAHLLVVVQNKLVSCLEGLRVMHEDLFSTVFLLACTLVCLSTLEPTYPLFPRFVFTYLF